MRIPFTSQPARWWYALKPASWPKVLVPALFGQALGIAATRHVSLAAVVFGLLWTVAHLASLVLLNDWADRDVDALKRRLFRNECSPKTIPDRILPADPMLAVGVVAGAFAIAIAGIASGTLNRPLLVPLAVLAALTFASYSLPPLRLNYRGGGELLEAFGVGVLLPVLHHYLQAGTLGSPLLRAMLPGIALLALASAIASGLSDEVSDRLGGKRTFVSTFGNAPARAAVEGLVCLAGGSFVIAGLVDGGPPPILVLPAVAIVGFFLARVASASETAVTNAFESQRIYKDALHRAIWFGTSFLAVGSVVVAFLSHGEP